MEYLKIKNWEKFQHYKNRNPPWIKLHNSILTNREFVCLQDASKLLLILLWMLASQHENRIPFDEEYLTKILMLEKRVNLKPLINAGFIEVYEDNKKDASIMLANCNQDESKMLDRGEESRAYKYTEEKEKACAESEKNSDSHAEDDASQIQILSITEENPSLKDTIVLVFPSKGKINKWELTQSKVTEWESVYPDLDVLAECRKARQWEIDNPGRMKTARGHTHFLFQWLERAQNGNGKRKTNGGYLSQMQQPPEELSQEAIRNIKRSVFGIIKKLREENREEEIPEQIKSSLEKLKMTQEEFENECRARIAAQSRSREEGSRSLLPGDVASKP